MKKLLAYHGDAKLKKSMVDRLLAHRGAEELVQGVGFKKNGQTKGCNIGCLFDHYDHAKGEKESGIPEALLRLADTIFEGLSAKDANDFAVNWPKAISPGADLSRVRWQFCASLMRENIERVQLLKIPDALKQQVVEAIRGVLNLHESATQSAAKSAARSARSAAWSAESAAGSAAESAARSARSAAWSARSAAYKKYAKEFIRLLREAK